MNQQKVLQAEGLEVSEGEAESLLCARRPAENWGHKTKGQSQFAMAHRGGHLTQVSLYTPLSHDPLNHMTLNRNTPRNTWFCINSHAYW